MDANTFLKGRKKPVEETSGPETVSEQGSSSSPLVIHRDTAPSGIVVEYCASPRWYKVDGNEVPSVTTVLDVLRKDGLSFWGQDVGVRAVLELFKRNKIGTTIDWKGEGESNVVILNGPGLDVAADSEGLKKLITAERLSCNHVLTKAGDRGTSVHTALEKWAQSGGEFFDTPQNFPDEERPYVEGLLKWVDTLGSSGKPVLCEVMVGSKEHGFAGRYDLVIELTEPVEFIVKNYKRKENKTVTIDPGRYLVDLKSSKGVYESHFLQLEAYEGASLECGYAATQGRFVLHVTADGLYEFVPSKATFGQFLAVKQAYDALKELKAA